MISSSSLSSESDSESGNVSDVSSVVSSKDSRSDRQYEWDSLFLNFTGWESWKTCYTCCDDMASRRGWDHEKHLDMLLPNLQGLAGDYVLDEISSEECSNYKVLIKCLKCRFCKVESAKTYATIIWKGEHKASETEESYSAELKHIYGKAYLYHDCFVWDGAPVA